MTGQPLSGYPVSEWGDTSSDRSASLWLSCVGVGGTLVVTGQPLSGYPVSEWGDTSSDRSASLWLSCVGVGGHYTVVVTGSLSLAILCRCGGTLVVTGSLSLAILCRSGGTLVVTGQPLSGYPVSEWGDTSSDRSASLWLSCVGVGGHYTVVVTGSLSLAILCRCGGTLVVTGSLSLAILCRSGGTLVVTGQPLSGYPVSEWGDTSSDSRCRT